MKTAQKLALAVLVLIDSVESIKLNPFAGVVDSGSGDLVDTGALENAVIDDTNGVDATSEVN